MTARVLVGVDEVGRGCLAGPVWACAYAFRAPGTTVKYLADSKKVSKPRREKLVPELQSLGWFGHGLVSPAGIDEVGIGRATFAAMKLAVQDLRESSGLTYDQFDVVVDGNLLPKDWADLPLGGLTGLVKADASVPEVSAASVLAKVARDSLMRRLGAVHPGYAFDEHAGYGTPKHLQAIATLGPSTAHRMSFAPMNQRRPTEAAAD